MYAKEMSGKPIAEKILEEVKKEAEYLKTKNKNPGLGTILVGNDPNCSHYVDNKHKTCKTVGIDSFNITVPESSTQSELLKAVDDFNNNPLVDAFMIQSPVPKHFDFNEAVK